MSATIAEARGVPADVAATRSSWETLAFLPGVNLRPGGASGSGSLTYQGLRGGQLAQTWQGIQVNNLQLGAGDLDELAFGLVDKVAVGSSSAFGTAAQVATTQAPSSTRNVSLGFRSGKGFGARLQVDGLRLVGQADALDNPHSPAIADEQARFRQLGGSFTAQFNDKRWTSSSYLLVQERQLPVTVGALRPDVPGTSTQLNTLLARQVLTWQPVSAWSISGGMLYDELQYTDPASQVSGGHTWQSLLSTRVTVRPWLLVCAEGRYIQSDHDEYTARISGLRFLTTATAEHGLKSVFLSATVGFTGQEDLGLGAFGSAEAQWEVSAQTQVRLRAGSHVRLANYDDLRWQQGGTPDLLPERTLEAVLAASHRMAAFTVDAEAYLRRIDDYLLWLPALPVWRPTNLARVHNYGGHLGAAFAKTFPHGGVSLHSRVELTRLSPVGLESNHPYAALDAEQLPFVPTWSTLLGGKVTWARWSLHCQTRYVGNQWLSYGGFDLGAAYWLSDLTLSYDTPTLTVYATVSNAFNARIAAPALTPTPLRRYTLTATVPLPSKPAP